MLKQGDLARVGAIQRNNTHPDGTIVKILLVAKDVNDPKPYYAQSAEGTSCYWYKRNGELEKL